MVCTSFELYQKTIEVTIVKINKSRRAEMELRNPKRLIRDEVLASHPE